MNLRPTEVDAFLKYLFTTVARKPRRLKLQQTAQAARYLHAIADEMRGGRERSELARLADTLWLGFRVSLRSSLQRSRTSLLSFNNMRVPT